MQITGFFSLRSKNQYFVPLAGLLDGMKNIQYKIFEPKDFKEATILWSKDEGIQLGLGDSYQKFENFLLRNPDTNFIATLDDKIIGTIQCGHDGRRALIYHLYVAPEFRRKGIAKKLLEKSIEGLAKNGIERCLASVFSANNTGNPFWTEEKWIKFEDIDFYYKDIKDVNAS